MCSKMRQALCLHACGLKREFEMNVVLLLQWEMNVGEL